MLVNLMLTVGLVGFVSAEYLLSIELNRFNNPDGLLSDGSKCASPTCLTYFKFCLIDDSQCVSKLETDIIGANVISEDQFQLTTSSIQFRFNSSGGNDHQPYLQIQVLNYERPRGGDESDVRPSTRLISEWKLDIRFFNFNQWIRYENSVNQKLGQEFLFDYKLQCAEDYYGDKCEIPMCATGCDLSRGGYCLRPNECICRPGYFGANCDLAVNESEIESTKCQYPCQNGGKCVAGKCKCDTRLYDGPQCQIRVIIPCPTATTCMNGASCLPTGECLCPPGYTGQRCQIKRLNSHCGPVTCYNGGTCFIDNQNEYSCLCDPAFRDKFCKSKIPTLPPPSAPQISTRNPVFQPPAPIHVLDSNYYFTVEEMMMIVLVGIGMPLFLILLTCFLCRLTIRKHIDQYSNDLSLPSSSSSSSSSTPIKSKIAQIYHKPAQKQNIYVSNISGQAKTDPTLQDPNTVYASLYEDFVPSGVKSYVLESNYYVMSSIV